MKSWRNDYPNWRKKSEKPKTSLTLRQKRLLASNKPGDFMTVFNEIHNSHLVSTSVGEVIVRTTYDKKKTGKKDS